MILFLALAATATPTAPATPFHIDNISPGEGAESDCATIVWRADAKPIAKTKEPADIFERVEDTAWMKIDGKIHILTIAKSAGAKSPLIFSDASVSARLQSVITKTDKSPDGDIHYLKGTLNVIYGTSSQSLNVLGEDFCYNGN